LVFDVDSLEHRVVEASAHRRPRLQVRRVAVPGEPDRCTEDVLPAVQVALHSREFRVGGLLGNADPVLLDLQELKRDPINVDFYRTICGLDGTSGFGEE
jgi:hypothetical protein